MLKIKEDKHDQKIEIILFCFSMFIFLVIGIALSYTFDFSNNFNLLFESDTRRVISDISVFNANHYRINVHPLFLIIIQPLFYLLNIFVVDKMLTIIILSALASSLTVLFIYKTLSLFSDNLFLKLLIILCYIFSFTSIIFTSVTEIYNFATLFLVILFYYFIKKIKNKTKSKYFLIVLGVLAFAFTLTNYIIFLIIIFILLISKNLKFLEALYIVLISIFLIIDCSFFQAMIWPNTPFILKTNFKEENDYSNYNISLKNVNNVLKNDYANALIANDLKIKVINGYYYNGSNYVLDFQNSTLLKKVLVVTFYLLSFIVLFHNFNKNKYINLAIILALLFNTSLHTIYGNTDSFLYSMHFLYLIFLLFGINILEEKNNIIKKISTIFLSIFLLMEIFINTKVFIKILDITSHILNYKRIYEELNKYLYFISILLLSIIVVLLIYLMIKWFKKTFITRENGYLKRFILIIVLFKIFFLGFNYLTQNLLPADYVSNNILDITNYVHSDLEIKYKDEFLKLKKYEEEYRIFINKYQPNIINNLIKEPFYFFGFANRPKFIFKKNGLFDIQNNQYIYEFDIKEYQIIPNIYTVVLETSSGDFIKIYEDESGIYYEKNDIKELIKGTDIEIKLYDFHKQEYQEIKKVLYSEILFNIKDNKIYPNIFVYKDVWYRDAALVAMVLKETNNIDLIKEWVSNIKEIYDYQNKGIAEVDNLGELLFIISTQEKINSKLVNKIIAEAEKNSNNNNGHLSGETDFQVREAYQNLWYKFGIEKLNKKFNYDIKDLKDDYENLTWWSNYSNKNYKIYNYDYNYPYLAMAQYHKLKQGTFYVNNDFYPLSWENNASGANYQNLNKLDNFYVKNKMSPTHSWAAAEMLLFLLDETNDLKY